MDLSSETNLLSQMDWLSAVLLMLTVVSVIVCYIVAKARRASIRKWVILGILFGPFAVPFVFFASPKK